VKEVVAQQRPRTRISRALLRARSPSAPRGRDGGRAAADPELERALERLVTAAERACEALGWLGWEARHAAEQQLRYALNEVVRLRGTKRGR
jgi:hypothetical protein